VIGVIADDLTGAAEIGAVGVRHGLRAEVIGPGCSGSDADLVCLDSDSRSCTADEAGRRTLAAANKLKEAGAEWIYKKVDSVLRGQVAAELEALLTSRPLGLKRALLVPANPSLGRIIRGGRYFVHDKPIHETEFARDPEHPRTSAKVHELLGRPKNVGVEVCGVKAGLAAGGITVGEATTPADLRAWAVRRGRHMLVAGAAEFFGALLTEAGHASPARRVDGAAVSAEGRELFVSGTTSRSTRDFLSAARTRRVPIFSLPAELAWRADFTPEAMEAIASRVIGALRTHPRVILNIGLPSIREPVKARLLADHLVQLAAVVMQRSEIGHVYAEGGATAAALVRRMEWNRLSVLRELAPGVATLAVKAPKAMFLTIKPGSYTWPASVRDEISADCAANV
jgi:uncharacterized protein YgbK (DUF1537 family)